MLIQHLSKILRKRIATPDGIRMRLNRLEKPEPWSYVMQMRMRIAMDADEVQQYPDYPSFYSQLAAFNDVPPDRVVVGAGIEEFIRSLFMIAGGKVAFLWPTCAMFDLYARIFDVPVQRIVTDPRRGITAEEIAAQLDGDVKLLLLANPGQPVDVCLDLDGLAVLARRTADIGAIFAIDEAYHGFGAPTGISLTEEFDHVTVLRTFSKAWGAASIRLGWAVSSMPIHRALDAVRQSGEVSSMSMAIALTLMRECEHVQAAIQDTIAGRDYLRDAVNLLPHMAARGRWANHVLIEHVDAETCSRIARALAVRGILVKADFPSPLDRYMLVTCGGVRLMREFFNELTIA